MSVPCEWSDEFLLYTARGMRPPRTTVVTELADRYQISLRRVQELQQRLDRLERILTPPSTDAIRTISAP